MRFKLEKESGLLCPSARDDSPGALIFGVIGGTPDSPIVAYVDRPQPMSEGLRNITDPVTPTEVFRFAAPCMCDACPQFKNQKCQVGEKIVKFLPTIVDSLPPCSIRANCRWWQQEGISACLRCPQVVTDNYNPSDVMRKVGDPVNY